MTKTWLSASAALLLLGLSGGKASAREVQSHGFRLEHWLCDTFFNGYRATDYTQRWDIPASANRDHGGLPVNPKAAKYGSSIGLGDALRQFEITEQTDAFILIAAFWEQADADTKRWVNVQALTLTPALWRRLWGDLQRHDLERLQRLIQDRSLSVEEARRQAQALKARPPYSTALITLNPKIDDSQRRLQCSLRFSVLFDHLAPQADRSRQPQATLWGHPLPPLHDAAARTFKQ
ncbi:MAG: hypothetical protein KDK99_06205 [Verrucomicrobiales bacterium]|nr:hypothetical protein [Verrucomicrobiales bacterium]